MTSDLENNSINSYSQRGIKNILIPIDDWNEPQYALRYAIALARYYDAKLFLFHCADQSLPDGGMRVREYFQELIALFNNPSYSPLSWQGIISEGKPATEICSAATTHQIDLIIMPSRRRPLAAALFGSTTEKVYSNAPCPVVVIHQQDRALIDKHNETLSLKRVLVGYDYSHFADLALAYGISFAKKYGCELHILRVLPIVSDRLWKPASLENLQQEINKLLKCVPKEMSADINIKPVIVEGQPADEILTYSEKHDIDLICLGNHGETAKHLLGTTVDRVMRNAKSPVLVACPLAWDLSMAEDTHNKRVLIAYDGSPFSNIALREVAERIWPVGTELRVISVEEPLSTLGSAKTHYRLPYEVVNALEMLAVEASNSLAGEGRVVSHIIRSGRAAEAIITEAQQWQADLIIIGTHSRQGFAHMILGSVAEEVAAKAPCSVEIVRHLNHKAVHN